MRASGKGIEAVPKQQMRGLILSVLAGFFVLGLLIAMSQDLRTALCDLMGFNANDHAAAALEEARSATVSSSATVMTPASRPPNSSLSDKMEKKTLIVRVKTEKNATVDIFDEHIPSDCHSRMHTDFDGDAVRWGLGNKASSATQCCRQCKELKGDRPCHVWVWCGDPSGSCWTMDIHKHTTGDCWLKHQVGWNGNKSSLKINHQGAFTAEFRAEHKTAPLFTPWMAGVIFPPRAKP